MSDPRPVRVASIWLAAASWGLLASVPVGAHDDDSSEHARSDEFWAAQARAQAAPVWVAPPAAQPAAAELQTLGEWGPVLAWPHIPVSAANLPDGRILSFASNRRTSFPSGPEFTYAAVWDPGSETLVEINHGQHDMFCGHLVMLEDGRVFVNGGRNTVPLTSAFDFQTDQWSLLDDMNRGRWYPTTVALSDGQVFTALGNGGGNVAEVWHPTTGWRDLLGINLASLMNGVGFEKNWWPFLSADPTGRLFHYGPTPDMHRIDWSGAGSIQNLGPWMASNRWYPKHAAVVMYDEGRILVAGGDSDGADDTGSTARALTIDVNGEEPLVAEITSMNFPRRFASAVMLPTGEVLVVGGNTSGEKFSDAGTVLTPELWDPETGAWQTLADMSVPRNYHSVALLQADGLVFVGGGGLCNCGADHQDAQVYSPPYLFAGDGSPAPRPQISQAPAQVRTGESFAVQASPGLDRFTLIKMSATTHAVNTDQRLLTLPHLDQGGGSYLLGAHGNRDVLTPGYWMLFAVDGAGVPSVAHILRVGTAGAPLVTNPGPQVSAEGDTLQWAIAASDPDGDPLAFAAAGLPFGLSIHPVTGVISGSIPPGAEGAYDVSVDVSDATGPSTVLFGWTVLPEGLGSGSILREWWTGIPGTSVAALTGSPGYPDAPAGSDFPTRFEAPTNWNDDYGTRMRGYLHPPVSGSYRFWIASDDNGELWLSSDDMAANRVQIASVPGWSSSQQWDKYPAQESAPIQLQAGQPYYIEALQKEGGGGDNLAVAWDVPGVGFSVIDGLYLSPMEFAPNIDPVADQLGYEDEVVSMPVTATDPNGDPLTWSAQGLPPGLAIASATGMISGTIATPAMGSHVVNVQVDDGTGESAYTGFVWDVYPAGAALVAPLGDGVACRDSASGVGHLMYSAESVFDRFAANPPPAGSAAHFICVVFVAGQWYYDDDSAYHAFTPVPTDLLVAQLDLDLGTIDDLVGWNARFEGIGFGYAQGDLGFGAGEYGGLPDAGEFAVSGTFFVPNLPLTVPALPAWGRLGLVVGLCWSAAWLLARTRQRGAQAAQT